MKIAKWGNSLAVRIPKDVAEALGLEEGDEVELLREGRRAVFQKKTGTAEARRRFLERPPLFPRDFVWNREDANRRD